MNTKSNTNTNTAQIQIHQEVTFMIIYFQAGAIIGNPQLALWHSFANEAPEDPNVRAILKISSKEMEEGKRNTTEENAGHGKKMIKQKKYKIYFCPPNFILNRQGMEGQGGCMGCASMECTLSFTSSQRSSSWSPWSS